jgi:uncharacterized protein YbjT (DUF2867 family)
MQVLIVGGAGEVGRYLAKDLSSKGYEVTVLDRAPKSPQMDETLTIIYTQADLTDVASTRRAGQGSGRQWPSGVDTGLQPPGCKPQKHR